MSLLKVQANRCEVCGHIWVSEAILLAEKIRFEEAGRAADEIGLPIRCAKCKSPYWNREGRWVDGQIESEAGAKKAGEVGRENGSSGIKGGAARGKGRAVRTPEAEGKGAVVSEQTAGWIGAIKEIGSEARTACPECGAIGRTHQKGCKCG